MYENYMEVLFAASFGLGGGLARGVMEMMMTKFNSDKSYIRYFACKIGVSAIIGIIIGMAFSYDYKAAVLSGFIGIDILKGMFDATKLEKVIEVVK